MLAVAQRASFSSRRATVSVRAKESRIGIRPIPVPKGVTVSIDGNLVKAKVSAVRRGVDGRKKHSLRGEEKKGVAAAAAALRRVPPLRSSLAPSLAALCLSFSTRRSPSPSNPQNEPTKPN